MSRISYIIIGALFVAAKCSNAPSVIIVGAGPAGIAAATRLLESSITNITILEAEGRIGGRVNSVEFGDAIVELGAQWCHGQENNIVYELVENYGLLEPTELMFEFHDSSSSPVNQTFALELIGEIISIYGEEKKEGISVGEHMLSRYNESIAVLYQNDAEKLQFVEKVFEYYMGTILSLEGAFSWFDPSAKSDYVECEGNQLFSWQGRGYNQVLEVLMKKYPDPTKQLPIDDKIALNKEVTRISWDGENCQVECLDDSVYNSDYVIFTPSLGVLKDRYKVLFNPSLLQEKINAIEELNIGAVQKIFLHFPEKWWKTNTTCFSFLWTEKDKQQILKEFPHGPNDNGRTWVTNFHALLAVDGNPNVLLAWFSGEFVPEIELHSDDMIIDGVTYVLNRFLGHEFDVMKPDSILRHNWYSNPHFRGTYSFQTVESRKRKVSGEVVLSQPLTASNGKQTLLFAGEATHPIYYSTVHGAIETGHREADRIINLYK